MSVGLKINFQKSTLVPINFATDVSASFAQQLGCVVGCMPFTYLGLPMGTTRPTLMDLMPMICSVERRLSSAASLLDYGSKLTLVNSVISSIAIYSMCSVKLPVKVIEHLDKLRRQCLWTRKIGEETKSTALDAWTMVCRPKSKGGLGIVDLKLQNQGLLLKQLHKFYMKSNTPWCNLIWSKYYQSRGTPCYKRGGLLLGEGCSET